jgi:hypothetical protein
MTDWPAADSRSHPKHAIVPRNQRTVAGRDERGTP